ncbi:MAG: hypothetical protein JJ895_12120 [Balneolaceae bacterium]|nr:hypothetical protein [Balneolaceae bacterium]
MGRFWGVTSRARHSHKLTIVEIYNSLPVEEEENDFWKTGAGAFLLAILIHGKLKLTSLHLRKEV